MAQSALIVSPVGRWVSGSMTETVKTKYDGTPLEPDKYHFDVGVAFRKDDPLTNPMLQAMAAHAHTEFAQAPHVQGLIGQYNFTPRSGFSWKVKDGDLPNAEGKVNENLKGCYVVYFSSQFVTKCADQSNAEIGNDSPLMVRGNFIQVAFTVAGNGKTDATAGIFVNPQVYRFVAYGEAITGGVDAATAFAGHDVPTALPAGASATPLATPMSTASVPTAPAAPAPVAPAPAAPAPVAPAPAAPAQPGVAPHPNFADGPATPPTPVVTRPTDPAHIHAAGTPDEQWWINGAWQPAAK